MFMLFLFYKGITWQCRVILRNFHPELSLAYKGYFTDKPSNSVLATTTYSKRENINGKMCMSVN